MNSKYAIMKYGLIAFAVIFFTASQAIAVQYLRPSGTVSTGNFTAVGAPTLHEALDETSQNGDTDHITSGRNTTTCEINLGGSVIDPQLTSGHIVRFWFEGIGGGNETVTATLYEGATPIANSGGLSNNSGSYVEGTINLTGVEAGNITSYAGLSVQFSSSGCNKNNEEMKVTMLEMEIPDPPYSLPTISNPVVLSADAGTVRITVDDEGGVSVTEHGTYWNNSGPPVTQNESTLGTYSGGSPGTFDDTLVGLTAQSLIYFTGYATNSQGTAVTTEGTFYTETATQVTWGSIDGVTPSQMQINWTPVAGALNGSIVAVKAASPVSASPVDWSEYNDNTQYSLGDTLSDGSFIVYKGTGSNVTVTGLSTGTTYYVAVYAYTGSGGVTGGINYNEAITATGSQFILGPPAISTPLILAADSITATIGATVDSDGGGTLTDRGTVWNETGPPITEHQDSQGGVTTGDFSHEVTGLTPGTLIHFRGYATNAYQGGSTAYSEDGTFYTEPATQATFVSVTGATPSEMQINWTPVAGIYNGSIVVVKAGSPVSASPTDWTGYNVSTQYGSGDTLSDGSYVVYKGTGSNVIVGGLSTGITYHFAIFAYTGSGAVAGGINFNEDITGTGSKLIVGPPLLTTSIVDPDLSVVTTNSAVIGATIVNDGGTGSLISRGTFWNTTGPPIVENQVIKGGTAVEPFSQTVFGLPAGQRIYFRAYAENSFGFGYSPLSYFHTEPDTQASAFIPGAADYESVSFSITRGNGDGIIIVAKEGGPVDAVTPVDGTVYNYGSFGNGDELGTGNFVIFAGNTSSYRVFGLNPSTTYHFAIYEYVGSGPGQTGINYKQTPSPLPGNMTTTSAPIGMHNWDKGIGCNTCHGIHGGLLPRGSDQEAACLDTCHYPGGAADPGSSNTKMTNVIRHPYGTEEVDCGACHEVHSYDFTTTDTHAGGTTALNVGHVRWDVQKYIPGAIEPAIFQDKSYNDDTFLAYDTAPYNGLCQACHSQATTDYHRNDGTGISHPAEKSPPVGTTCVDCHPHSTGFAPDLSNSSCQDPTCHADLGGAGPRREVVTEFGMTAHHVGPGITDEDCAVCHYEAIDKTNYHMNNGIVDLRDPDDGGVATLISFTGDFLSARNHSSDALEPVVTAVQNDFCMKCHDSDASRGGGLGGASATFNSTDGGDPTHPFSTGNVVPDVYGQFDPTQDSFHPVRTTVGNTACDLDTMEAPWNQQSSNPSPDLITCFDCHESNGHGSANQRMALEPVDFDELEAGTTASDGKGMVTQTTVENFCSRCHKRSVYLDSGSPATLGSTFDWHGSGQAGHGNNNGSACYGCHSGLANYGVSIYNGAARGNTHGASHVFTGTNFTETEGVSSDYFMVGGFLTEYAETGTQLYCGGCQHGKGRDETRVPQL